MNVSNRDSAASPSLLDQLLTQHEGKSSDEIILERCLQIEAQYPLFVLAPHHILVEYASLVKFLLGRK